MDDDEERPPQLTVAALIELLKQEHPDDHVMIEGCDCQGEACGVTTEVIWDKDAEDNRKRVVLIQDNRKRVVLIQRYA